jgi:NADH-quinone oxidoreductase subunit G
VISFSAFDTPALRGVSDWLLPIAGFAETAGSYVNANATWQTSPVALQLLGEAKPGWKVLRVLGNMMAVPGFDYVRLDEVTSEAQTKAVSALALDARVQKVQVNITQVSGLSRVAVVPMFAGDMLLRQAPSLQAHEHAGKAVIRVNPADMIAASDLAVATGMMLESDVRVAVGNWLAPIALKTDLGADQITMAVKE